MRLGVILCILTPVLLAAGVASFAGVASRAGWETYPPRPEVVMGVLLLCSAASALLWLSLIHI